MSMKIKFSVIEDGKKNTMSTVSPDEDCAYDVALSLSDISNMLPRPLLVLSEAIVCYYEDHMAQRIEENDNIFDGKNVRALVDAAYSIVEFWREFDSQKGETK